MSDASLRSQLSGPYRVEGMRLWEDLRHPPAAADYIKFGRPDDQPLLRAVSQIICIVNRERAYKRVIFDAARESVIAARGRNSIFKCEIISLHGEEICEVIRCDHRHIKNI